MDAVEAPPPPRRRLHWRILRGIAMLFAALVALVLVGLWGTIPGRGTA